MNSVYKNKAELAVHACGETRTICSNEVCAEKIVIKIHKTQNKQCVFDGDCLEYTVKICNESHVDIHNAIFCDDIPDGLKYVPHSFKVDNHPKPVQQTHGNKISYQIDELKAKCEVTIVFEVTVL